MKLYLAKNLFQHFLSLIIIFCLDKAAKRTRQERSDRKGKHSLVSISIYSIEMHLVSCLQFRLYTCKIKTPSLRK